MPVGVPVFCDDSMVLDDARISDRKTISVPATVLKHLCIGPRDYLRFLLKKSGEIELRGMALTPIDGSEIDRIADERVAEIRNGQSLTLETITEFKPVRNT